MKMYYLLMSWVSTHFSSEVSSWRLEGGGLMLPLVKLVKRLWTDQPMVCLVVVLQPLGLLLVRIGWCLSQPHLVYVCDSKVV